MPRADFSVQQIQRISGLTPSYTAAQAPGSGSNAFQNEGKTCIHIKNGSGSSMTATFQTAATLNDLAVADLVITVGAGAEKLVGPFEPGIFNQSDGKVYVDWSLETSVTAAVLRL